MAAEGAAVRAGWQLGVSTGGTNMSRHPRRTARSIRIAAAWPDVNPLPRASVCSAHSAYTSPQKANDPGEMCPLVA